MDQQYAWIMNFVQGPGETLIYTMRDSQPNPELMLDSKTHSRAADSRPAAANDISRHFAGADQKSRHSALDFSHSNPDFCHPISREKIAMHMAHLISKNSMKTAAERLW